MFPRIIFVISYKLMMTQFSLEAIAIEGFKLFYFQANVLIFVWSGSSVIKIYPSAEFNATKVLVFPDDNTLLIDLDRSVPQDLVDQCVF